jgi:hypothetical protein
VDDVLRHVREWMSCEKNELEMHVREYIYFIDG